ncbi:aminoglycoside phosphotransferase family protein [Paenibacillus sp. y28]
MKEENSRCYGEQFPSRRWCLEKDWRRPDSRNLCTRSSGNLKAIQTRIPEGSLTRAFADLHYHIHQYELDMKLTDNAPVQKQKTVLAQNIQRAPQLSDKVKKEIIDYLDGLPDGSCLCHGDFHPDNVLIGEQNWVIDWMTATVGNPAGDVARTLLLFRFGTLPDGAPKSVTDALERMRNTMNEVYLEQYLAYSGLPFSAINEGMLPVAAARLSEWISDEEKALLLPLISDRLK